MNLHTQTRLAILLLAIASPIACTTFSPPQPPPTRGATLSAPALTPTAASGVTTGTPANVSTTGTPASVSATGTPSGIAATGTAPSVPASGTAASVAATDTPAPPLAGLAPAPRGLSAVNNFEASTRVGSLFDPQTYANPSIAGLTFRTSWADIEPTEGNFVWTKLDTVFDAAEKNNKWVELVLIPGFGTPAWALQGAQTATFAVKYGPGKGDNLPLPLPWDQTYLRRWFDFLKAVGARYQNRPSFVKIAADGPTSVTAEMSLPNADADLCTWLQVGYTSDQLIAAWQQVFASYAQIFPRQYFSLALYPPPPIVAATRCDNGNLSKTDHNESQRVRGLIVSMGASGYPKQFALQTNGLTAAKEDPGNMGGYALVKSYAGQVVTGFQLTTSAIMHPTNMGDADGPTALRNSLQMGLDANAQFLEVYEPDVLSPAAQSVLATFASKLAAK